LFKNRKILTNTSCQEARLFGMTTLARPVFVVLFGIAHFVAGPFWSGPFWHEFHENNFFSIF